MSELFKDVKDNLNKWWKDNGPKVEDMLKTTAKKTEELTHKAKLKYDIFQKDRDVEKAFAELGAHVHTEITESNNSNFSEDAVVNDSLEKIKTLEEEVKVLRQKYEEVGEEEDIVDVESESTEETKE